MQKHRFEIWLTNIDRADLNAALVGFAHNRCKHILGFMCNDRHFMVAGTGFKHILHAIKGFRQRLLIIILAEV